MFYRCALLSYTRGQYVCSEESQTAVILHGQYTKYRFYEEQLRLKRYDAPPLPPVAKVNATTLAVQPSEETVAWMQEMWTKIVEPKTGCKNYDEMLAMFNKETTAA